MMGNDMIPSLMWWQNYFFLNPNDMKSIGLLIDNEDLYLNFKDYNDSGRQISTVLQQLGVSLSRVIRNEDKNLIL